MHPDLLPKYRDASCVELAIFYDDLVVNTAYFMTEEYHAGSIIEAKACSIERSATYQDIRVRIYVEAIDLMAVGRVLNDEIMAKDLPSQGESQLFKPIDAAAMAIVKEKVAFGSYAAATEALMRMSA